MTDDRGAAHRQRIDAETLAAFMEGELGQEERERVLAHLAASDEDLEILAGAAAVASEFDDVAPRSDDIAAARQKPAAPPFSPNDGGTPTARAGGIWRIGLPLAAVIAALVVIPALRSDGARQPSLEGIGAELALLREASATRGLPELAWSAPTRSGSGGELLDSLWSVARAFREGVLMARLGVVEGATRRTSPETPALERLLSRSTAGSAASLSLRRWVAAETSDEAGSWGSTAEVLATVEGEPAAFHLGVLTERVSLGLALAQPPSAPSDDTIEALRTSFEELPGPARTALAEPFSALVEGLTSASAAASERALAAFMQAAGNLTPPSPAP